MILLVYNNIYIYIYIYVYIYIYIYIILLVYNSSTTTSSSDSNSNISDINDTHTTANTHIDDIDGPRPIDIVVCMCV